jgi:hypothetical protein
MISLEETTVTPAADLLEEKGIVPITRSNSSRRSPRTRGRVRRLLRRVLTVAVIGVGLSAMMLGVLLFPVVGDPSGDFLERRGELVSAVVTHSEPLADTTLSEVSLTSSSGLQVELSVRVPRELPPPWPVVLLLGGQRTGRDAVRLAGETRGVVFAALSYPFTGDPEARGARLLAQVPKMQRALLDTPPAVMLALDHLLALPGVDAERVELVGVSFGAFLVGVPGALDPRPRRVWFIHGAGRPADVIESGLRRHVGNSTLRGIAARYLATVAGGRHLAPELWAPRIAPRPVVAINAEDDDALPRECIEALHRSLGEPSEVIWTRGGHVLPRKRDVVRDLAQRVLERALE